MCMIYTLNCFPERFAQLPPGDLGAFTCSRRNKKSRPKGRDSLSGKRHLQRFDLLFGQVRKLDNLLHRFVIRQHLFRQLNVPFCLSFCSAFLDADFLAVTEAKFIITSADHLFVVFSKHTLQILLFILIGNMRQLSALQDPLIAAGNIFWVHREGTDIFQ